MSQPWDPESGNPPNRPPNQPPNQQRQPPPPSAYPPPGYGYPPPGYGYPPPGYGYGPAYGPPVPPGPKPSSNIGWAIAAILTFWPLAIPAFIFSSRVDDAWRRGDLATAESASRSARMFGVIAVVIGGLVLVVTIIVLIVAVAFVANTVDVVTTVPPLPYPT